MKNIYWSVDIWLLCCVCVGVCVPYPVQLNGVNPLVSVLWVLCSEVPHAVVHTNVQSALIKLMRLKQRTHNPNTLTDAVEM